MDNKDELNKVKGIVLVRERMGKREKTENAKKIGEEEVYKS